MGKIVNIRKFRDKKQKQDKKEENEKKKAEIIRKAVENARKLDW